MLTKEQEKQILDAIYEARRNGNCTDMMFAAVKAYDKIVNPPVVDDDDQREFIPILEMLRDNHHKKSFAYHTLQKAIDFINKSHTKN